MPPRGKNKPRECSAMESIRRILRTKYSKLSVSVEMNKKAMVFGIIISCTYHICSNGCTAVQMSPKGMF